MTEKRILETIIHCDDLGATQHSSTRIFDAWLQGALDGFSILPNGAALELVEDTLAEHAGRAARIAVHLNLIEGRPLSPAQALPHLVGADGLFAFGSRQLVRDFLLSTASPELLREIEIEWRAQIQRVRELARGRPITALDSHQHVHMIPALFALAARLAKEEGIPEIRITRERFSVARPTDILRPRFLGNSVKYLLLKFLAQRDRALLAAHGLTAPDSVLGVLYSGEMSAANIRHGLAVADRRGARRVEVIVHVGRVDVAEVKPGMAGTEEEFYVSEAREREFNEILRFRRP